MSEENLAGQDPAHEKAVPVADTESPSASELPPSNQDAPEIEASDDAEGSEPSEDNQEQEQERKPRQKASERIGELYGRMKSYERENEQLRAELQRLQEPIVQADQWDQLSYDQQQYAITKQAVREERAYEVQREIAAREQAMAHERQRMFEDRLEQARARIPDIDRVIADPTLPVTEVGARFIQESESGPQVAYWLSQNRAEANRIANLDPYRQAYELGKVEARVSAPVQARKVSQAPKPVSTINGGGTPGAKSVDSMSVDEIGMYLKSKKPGVF